MRKLVYGVGTNDADYVVQVKEESPMVDGKRKQRVVWNCPFYQTWVGMLRRGYSAKFKARYPTYKDALVCKWWHLFSTFKGWMEAQNYEGMYLDKDLLVRGNKIYSPETCVFVSATVNSFLLESNAARGECLIGVYWNKQRSKFNAGCRNPFTDKRENLGYFDSEIEAHKSWLKRKLQLAQELASLQTDERVAKALVSRYENYSGE